MLTAQDLHIVAGARLPVVRGPAQRRERAWVVQVKRRRLKLIVIDNTPLRRVRLKESRFEETAQVRHGRNRRGGASLLAVDALEHCAGRDLGGP